MSRKQKILNAAKALFESQKAAGLIAVLSPTPMSLIELTIKDISEYFLEFSSPVIVDIGCGDGRWIISWVVSNSKCLGIGLDIDYQRISLGCVSKDDLEISQSNRIDFIVCDYNQFNIGAANVVVVYLSRYGNELIKDKIISQCISGTLVVAVGFQMIGWHQIKNYNSSGISAYLYKL